MDRVRRLVVKIGSAIITESSGGVSPDRLAMLVEQVADAVDSGVEVAIVTSGAIAAGIEKMGTGERPRDTETLQAVAAVGQGVLMSLYAEIFGSRGLVTAQVLLTQSDMTHRQQYLNARHTLERLFQLGAVPVINENDTVASDEITFGENDLLSALVASLVAADTLVLLTDTGGLHTADPRRSEEAVLITRVERITDEIESLCGGVGSELASGGMSSKVQAAKIAVNSGVRTFIADGREPCVISRILAGEEVGTLFVPLVRVRSKKHWIGYAKKSKGRLVVDPGAANALRKDGRSLLPAGVLEVEGDFLIGDSVDIVDTGGRLIGRGLTNYGASEAKAIRGLRSEQIEEVLGEAGEEIIHRDRLAVLDVEGTEDD